MIMNETQIKTYLKKLEFCIKDFNKTNIKYLNYKDNDFKQFLKNNIDLIKEYLQDLNEHIQNNIHNTNKCNFAYRQNDFKFNEKMGIRELKNIINYLTLTLNKDFLTENFNRDLNENEKRSFTIKFYMTFYNEINEQMKISLNDIIKENI